ncbi:MAG: DNA polymerase III subunit beta [Clostridia bacterium]|nr:DNA polymerase III subunit beta [Clostridia bacterium]
MMKIIFNKSQMSASVAPLMCAVSGKSTLTSIEGILIEAKIPDTLIMTTYDLEKGIRITTEAKVIEEGTFIINAQKFNQTLKVMDGEELTLTVEPEKLIATIESGKSVHRMNALAGADFPMIPKLESDKSFSISEGKLKSMLTKVMYAMGVNDQRPVPNGCYFEVREGSLLLVSCDSYKLAKCSLATNIKNTGAEGTELNFDFIVPSKTTQELYRMLDDDEEKEVRIVMTRKNIIFLMDEFIFFSRLVDGRYIDYEKIIVKTHKITTKISRSALLSALERAALITEERIAGSVRSSVKLQLDGGLLKIHASSGAGSTYDEIEIEHEGEDLLIAFNNRYLMDSVRACTADELKITLSSPLTSINIEPAYEMEGIEEKFMLLPVKMTN